VIYVVDVLWRTNRSRMNCQDASWRSDGLSPAKLLRRIVLDRLGSACRTRSGRHQPDLRIRVVEPRALSLAELCLLACPLRAQTDDHPDLLQKIVRTMAVRLAAGGYAFLSLLGERSPIG
jgi:hypothetical protein